MFQSNISGTMTTHMSIRGDTGNVGIGTTSPQKHVHIRGSAPYIRLEEDSASNKRLDLYVDPSTAIAYITANQSAQQLSFQTASTDRIRITNGGNVGISTLLPQYQLQVGGNPEQGFDGIGMQYGNIYVSAAITCLLYTSDAADE